MQIKHLQLLDKRLAICNPAGVNNPCVGCGHCCQTAQCGTGAAVFGPHKRCPGLVWVGEEQRYRCSLVLESETNEKLWWVREDLSIGAGCSSTLFNTKREETIKRQMILTLSGDSK